VIEIVLVVKLLVTTYKRLHEKTVLSIVVTLCTSVFAELKSERISQQKTDSNMRPI